MTHSTATLSFPSLAGTIRVLDWLSPSAPSILSKPLPALETPFSASPFTAQLRKLPIPAQVKLAASQAQAVVLTGLTVTGRLQTKNSNLKTTKTLM